MRLATIIVLIFIAVSARAQQLDQLGKKDAVKVNGGMGYNVVSNFVADQPQYRDPFSWVYSGNLSVNVLGVSLPFTFSFSNAGKSYTQPFNMTALHPSYKWVKTHIGITSMSFSPYTYSGLNFAGGGVELSPKKWKIQGFAGRLKKAVEYDAETNNITTVSYRRMGYAMSVGYETQKAGIKMIVLKAQDDERSLAIQSPNTELVPQDNIVTSLGGKITLFGGLNLQAEFANSLLTRNVMIADSLSSGERFYYPLIRGNSSTISRNAYNTSLNYRYKIASISVKYERVDPGYMTLGALYFNNDLENITIAPAVVLFKNKLNITLNSGLQRNNLSNTNASVQRRWVGSATLSAQPVKGMSISGSYSNFSSFSRRNPSADPFYNIAYDTMNYYQISENYNLTTNYAFGDSLKQNLCGAFVYSKSQNITGRLQDASAFGFNVSGNDTGPVDVYTAMFSHNFQFRNGFTIGYTANMNRAIALGQSTTYLGPGMNLAKPFFNRKLNMQCGSTYNRQMTGDTLTNHVMNFRLGANISPQLWDKKYGKISMSLNANYTQKFAVIENALSPKNLTIIANINYGF